MVTFNFATTKNANPDLEIAALDYAVFLAVGKSVALPAHFAQTSGDLAALPVGLLPVGNLDKKAAVSLDNSITSTPVETYGQQTPSRIIRKSREITVDFTMQEANAVALGTYWGQDFTGVEADPVSGEVNLVIAETAFNLEYRCVMIGEDGSPGEEVYTIYDGPRATLSKAGKLQYNDDGIGLFPVTLSFLKDRTYGYALRQSYAGLGYKVLGPAAGFGPQNNTVTLTGGTFTAGTFTLTYTTSAGVVATTAGIAYNAIASVVQTALTGLSNIGVGNATVTGSAGGPYTTSINVHGALTGSGTSLTPSGTVVVT